MSSVEGQPVLECESLGVTLGDRQVLAGVTLSLAAGEAVAVVGPSGSGKTTLLHTIAGLVEPDSGTVRVAGHPVSGESERRRARLRRELMGLVFQFGELLAELTVLENVLLPALLRRQAGARAAARRALEQVGLGERCDAYPDQLSGGEMQRAGIARAVVGQPALVLADEPTGALDEANSIAVCKVLRSAASGSGAALVVATHDPVVASQMDAVWTLRGGRLGRA